MKATSITKLSDAQEDFFRCATEIGQSWCSKLVATNLLGFSVQNDFRNMLQVDTVYGRIRFCGPVTVLAQTSSGHGLIEVRVNSTEALQNILHLPTSGHYLEHWFAGEDLVLLKAVVDRLQESKSYHADLLKMLW